jgi:hypothetical protein
VSPNPVTAVATWTVALLVDVVAVGVAALVLLWDHGCPQDFAGCPAGNAADTASQDAWVLVLLGVVLLVVAAYGLLRGRWLLLVVQLALLVVLVLAAQALVPDGLAQLRRDLRLSGEVGTAGNSGVFDPGP